MRSRWYSTWFFIVLIFLSAALAGAVYILFIKYDALIASVAASLHKNGLEQKIRNGIFPRSRFLWLQKAAWLVILLIPFCGWFAIRYRFAVVKYGHYLFTSVTAAIQAIAQVFKTNPRQQNNTVIVLMAVIIQFYTYSMVTSFLTYDEMWSYNYYTDHPFYYSFFIFSNYPLFETTTHFFKWWPFPMHINLRLSPFFFSIASCIVLYACLRKYFNSHFTAMAGLAAFAFTPLTVFYAANARGVMPALFFTIAGIFSFLYWMERPTRKQYMVMYFLSAVLGVYAMPTHVLFLFFLPVAGVRSLLQMNRDAVLLFIKTNLFIAAGIIILYAPLIIITGSSVLGEVINSAPSYETVVRQAPHVVGSILMGYTGFNYINLALYLVAILVLILMKNKLPPKRHILVGIVAGLPVSTAVFYLITKFEFAGRSLAFGALSIPLLVCLFLEWANGWIRKNNYWANGAAVSALVLVILLDGFAYLPVNATDKNVANVSEMFMANNITSCYDNTLKAAGFFYYYPGIEYYYRQQHKVIEFTLAAKNSMRYKPLVPGDRYDCIVYDSHGPGEAYAAGYHEWYRSPSGKFRVWIRNDLK